jgi:hypothetical protein
MKLTKLAPYGRRKKVARDHRLIVYIRAKPLLWPSFGAHGARETPVPIPNTEVKPRSGYYTWQIKAWENSTVPNYRIKPPYRRLFLLENGIISCNRENRMGETINTPAPEGEPEATSESWVPPVEDPEETLRMKGRGRRYREPQAPGQDPYPVDGAAYLTDYGRKFRG